MSLNEKMSGFFYKIRNLFSPQAEWERNPVYSSIIKLDDGNPHRMHLRILNDYTGILTVDASFILYLNQTAAIYIQQWISGKNLEDIQDYFVEEFRTDKETIAEDFKTIKSEIELLLSQEDVNPVQLGFQNIEAFRHVHEIPLRVYLALTYKFDSSAQVSYSKRDVSLKDLDLSSQRIILDKLHELGVPQITLSGGEPTLYENYDQLIKYGEDKGIVMGLMTSGTIFHDKDLVRKVIQEGLDYVIIPFHTIDAKTHKKLTAKNDFEKIVQAITNFEEDDIYLKTKTTLLPENKDSIEDIINFLHRELKVNNIEVNGLINPPDNTIYNHGIEVNELISIITKLVTLAEEEDFTFTFTSPTHLSQFNPVDYGLGLTSTHPANTSITIEPNGDVLPVQYYFQSPGNILKDKWSKIWFSKLFMQIRKKGIFEKGEENDLLTFCGGGIPFHF